MRYFIFLALWAFFEIAGAQAAWYAPTGSAGTPTIGTCGTSPSVSGTDASGVITVGSGTVTSCALNFSATMPNVPACTISTSATVVTSISGLTTTVLTVTFASSSPSTKIYYACNLK